MPNIAMNAEQNKSNEPTPEQLMRLLDFQIEAQRARRAAIPQRGGMFVAAGLLFIIFAAVASLILLSDMIPNLPRVNREIERPPAAENSQ
jgi:hypothetical protein